MSFKYLLDQSANYINEHHKQLISDGITPDHPTYAAHSLLPINEIYFQSQSLAIQCDSETRIQEALALLSDTSQDS